MTLKWLEAKGTSKQITSELTDYFSIIQGITGNPLIPSHFETRKKCGKAKVTGKQRAGEGQEAKEEAGTGKTAEFRLEKRIFLRISTDKQKKASIDQAFQSEINRPKKSLCQNLNFACLLTCPFLM